MLLAADGQVLKILLRNLMIAVRMQTNMPSLLGVIYPLLNPINLLLKLRAISMVAYLDSKAESLLHIIVIFLVDIVLHNQLLQGIDLLCPVWLEDIIGYLTPQLQPQLVPCYFVSIAIDFGVVD